MKAVHWLRSRQEERELTYWLSLVAYEKSDHSFNNRIYLLYLIIFFGIWVFITLTFFAGGGALLLDMISPGDPQQAVLILEVLILAVWSLFSIWQSIKRCPIIFSEEDGLLISQTPVSRAQVVLRWLWMPWLKGAVLFWIIAITLGFSIAEVVLSAEMSSSRIIEYAGYGLRVWLAILPVQLLIFGFHWVLGSARMSTDRKYKRWLWIAIPMMTLVYGVMLILAAGNGENLGWFSNVFARLFLSPLVAGLTLPFNWSNWLPVWIAVALVLVILYVVSAHFSLNRAVMETSKLDLIKTAIQYGMTDLVNKEQTKNQLGVEQKPSRIPIQAGAKVLLWKNVLQSQRTFRWRDVFAWSQLFLYLFVLPILPDLGSRGIVLIVWIIQASRVSVRQIRKDLELWPVVRQLPFKSREFLLFDLLLTYLLAVVTSLSGILIGGLLFGQPLPAFVLILPGVIAAILCAANFDVIRHSRSGLMLNGSVPDLSAGGILLGIVFAGIPLLLFLTTSSWIGVIFAFSLSILFAYIVFQLTAYSYRNIDKG